MFVKFLAISGLSHMWKVFVDQDFVDIWVVLESFCGFLDIGFCRFWLELTSKIFMKKLMKKMCQCVMQCKFVIEKNCINTWGWVFSTKVCMDMYRFNIGGWISSSVYHWPLLKCKLWYIIWYFFSKFEPILLLICQKLKI